MHQFILTTSLDDGDVYTGASDRNESQAVIGRSDLIHVLSSLLSALVYSTRSAESSGGNSAPVNGVRFTCMNLPRFLHVFVVVFRFPECVERSLFVIERTVRMHLVLGFLGPVDAV